MTEVVNGTLRLLSDRVLVKPLAWSGSAVHGEGTQLEVIRHGRPLRGEVLAVGKGHYPVSKRTSLNDGRRRIEFSKHFRPTEVKPGDIVELGGLNQFDGQGYHFPEVIVNGVHCIICQERDVCIVRDDLRQVQANGQSKSNAAAA